MFPPGFSRLLTRPRVTGLAAITNTMGTVLVAFWATTAAGPAPIKIASTFCSTRSVTICGYRSLLPSALRHSNGTFRSGADARTASMNRLEGGDRDAASMLKLVTMPTLRMFPSADPAGWASTSRAEASNHRRVERCGRTVCMAAPPGQSERVLARLRQDFQKLLLFLTASLFFANHVRATLDGEHCGLPPNRECAISSTTMHLIPTVASCPTAASPCGLSPKPSISLSTSFETVNGW